MKMYQTRSLVLRIARQLMKTGLSFSEAQRFAWSRVKAVDQPQNAAFMTFRKVNGEICTRMVYLGSITDYVTLKGGRPLLNGLKAYVDLAKVYAGDKNPVISIYPDRVLCVQSIN
jgi:hypothetical protein